MKKPVRWFVTLLEFNDYVPSVLQKDAARIEFPIRVEAVPVFDEEEEYRCTLVIIPDNHEWNITWFNCKRNET